MRTEEDGNENMGHFVSVGARLAPLPRWEGVYFRLCRLSRLCIVRWEELPNVFESLIVSLSRWGVLLRLHRSYSLSV